MERKNRRKLKNHEMKYQFFEEINKIEKSFTRLTKKIREKSQIITVRNE
jgi:hypothetical protein